MLITLLIADAEKHQFFFLKVGYVKAILIIIL